MKTRLALGSVRVSFVLALLAVCAMPAAAGTRDANAPYEPATLYPPANKLLASPGNTTYFVDPAKGDNGQTGTTVGKAWKSLAKVNALRLAAGDRVVIAPGRHAETLKPSGEGTAEKPVVIQFLPGVHEFGVEEALRRPWFVSNACDAPTVPKPVGILIENAKHLRLQGGGVDGPGKTLILLAGRMIEVINNHAEDITYTGLVFDLKRPTVSEFRVLETAANSVVIRVAEGSTYEIKQGRFAWTGDLGTDWVMPQEVILATGQCWRHFGFEPFATAQATDLGDRKVRLSYAKGTCGMLPGHQFQFRRVGRDSVGVHNTRSKDLVFRDCDFYALTNMGMVSQFTENLTFQRVNVAPPKGTIRTCPAWADVFQFSNCRGDILVDSCRLSGMQDDPINCHGTHLRIIAKKGDNQLHVRFMHNQTYGFTPYAPGDEVAVIKHGDLRELPGNPRRRVTAVAPMPDDRWGKDWLVTLDGPAPAFGKDDVLDNVTWYPNLTARNNHVSVDSCRGFLLTTRGKVLIEGNTFLRCQGSAILVEDDAEGWFESGPVRDMTIRHNRFIHCGIDIGPQTHANDPQDWVHENIRIEDNFFDGAGVSARGVKGITVIGNRSPSGNVSVNVQKSCSEVKVEKNNIKATE